MADSPIQPTTEVLRLAAGGDQEAAAELVPLIYTELRRVARGMLARSPPGQTLQATALVHEAYLRVVGKGDPGWESRRHFFGAAVQAMRQIMVEQARRKAAVKHGGPREKEQLREKDARTELPSDDVLALDEALGRLESEDPRKAEIVMHRDFSELTIEETAESLGVSHATVEREWRYIRAWLHKQLS
jgi:RNA polymerase sigma factor (TIGR02999 family)